MFKKTKLSFYKLGAAMTTGLVVASAALPAAAANNFGTVGQNITNGISSVPGLLSAMAYLFGIILIILGILKIREHVEKPDQTPLKEGLVRLLVGGALLALPIIIESAKDATEGAGGNATKSAILQKVSFGVQ